MIEITWKIIQLESLISSGLVVKVTYSCEGVSENFSDRIIGTLDVEGDPSSKDFIPYEDLTEEIVVGWVKDLLSDKVSEIQNRLTDNLNAQEQELSEKQTIKGLPWR